MISDAEIRAAIKSDLRQKLGELHDVENEVSDLKSAIGRLEKYMGCPKHEFGSIVSGLQSSADRCINCGYVFWY